MCSVCETLQTYSYKCTLVILCKTTLKAVFPRIAKQSKLSKLLKPSKKVVQRVIWAPEPKMTILINKNP